MCNLAICKKYFLKISWKYLYVFFFPLLCFSASIVIVDNITITITITITIMCYQACSDLWWPLFMAFQVENTQKWFTIPFFWGCPGNVQFAKGHTGWLFSQEVLWGIEHSVSDYAAKYLTHWAILTALNEVNELNIFSLRIGICSELQRTLSSDGK